MCPPKIGPPANSRWLAWFNSFTMPKTKSANSADYIKNPVKFDYMKEAVKFVLVLCLVFAVSDLRIGS
jgi:hypothetical protein